MMSRLSMSSSSISSGSSRSRTPSPEYVFRKEILDRWFPEDATPDHQQSKDCASSKPFPMLKLSDFVSTEWEDKEEATSTRASSSPPSLSPRSSLDLAEVFTPKLSAASSDFPKLKNVHIIAVRMDACKDDLLMIAQSFEVAVTFFTNPVKLSKWMKRAAPESSNFLLVCGIRDAKHSMEAIRVVDKLQTSKVFLVLGGRRAQQELRAAKRFEEEHAHLSVEIVNALTVSMADMIARTLLTITCGNIAERIPASILDLRELLTIECPTQGQM